VQLEWGELLAFERPIWRYPEFVSQPEQAYAAFA